MNNEEPTPTPRELRPSAEAEPVYRRWLSHLNAEFTRHLAADQRAEIVRNELFQIYLGRAHGGRQPITLTSELAISVLAESFDPRNVTLEAEYLADLDAERFAARKPLLWFWRMFDRSPLGPNLWLGLRFRAMLGRHIFRHLGAGVRIFHNVEFTFGYNLAIEDNCVLHSGVRIDDRAEFTLRAGTIVPDYARVTPPGRAAP